MKLIRGLVKKNLKLIKNKKWYHQRFDGSPLFLTLISMAELTPEKRKLGCHCTSHFGLFENDKADWYIDLDDINRVANRVINLGMKTPHFSKKLMKNWERDMENFYKFCHELEKIDLKKFPHQELKNLYGKYVSLDLKAVSSSSIIDGFSLGTDELIQKK